MYIKVAVSGSDPVIYRLSRAEVLIGSAPTCHIIIPHPSISKKHIKIARDEASWYAADQGSTNGTHLDDEQLVPGKRVELTPESELRLGDKVFVTLIEIAQNALELNNPAEPSKAIHGTVNSDQDKTRVISLDDLKKAKATVVKNKQREIKKAKIQEKKVKQKESKKFSNLLIIVTILIFAGYIGSNWWKKHKNEFIKKETVVKKVTTKFKSDDEIETDLEGFRIRRSLLLTRNQIIDHFNKYKECLQEEVRDFCLTGVIAERGNGAQFITPSSFVFFINETNILPSVFAVYMRDPKISVDMARNLTLFSLLESDFKPEQFPKGSNLYIALYHFDEMGIKRISTITALKASLMKELLDEFRERKFLNPETNIEAGLKEIEKYYTIY